MTGILYQIMDGVDIRAWIMGALGDPREAIMILGHDGVCYRPESGRDATTDGDIFWVRRTGPTRHTSRSMVVIGRVAALFHQGVTGHSQELRKTAQHSIA